LLVKRGDAQPERRYRAETGHEHVVIGWLAGLYRWIIPNRSNRYLNVH
jgi:hypothetical protein